MAFNLLNCILHPHFAEKVERLERGGNSPVGKVLPRVQDSAQFPNFSFATILALQIQYIHGINSRISSESLCETQSKTIELDKRCSGCRKLSTISQQARQKAAGKEAVPRQSLNLKRMVNCPGSSCLTSSQKPARKCRLKSSGESSKMQDS